MADVLMFMWIQGIYGLSQDPRHLREIEVVLYQVGNNAEGAVGIISQSASVSDFEFVKVVDGASSVIHQAVASGRHFANAVFTIERNYGGRSGGVLMQVSMRDILFTRADQDKPGGPTGGKYETIGFNYASAVWKT